MLLIHPVVFVVLAALISAPVLWPGDCAAMGSAPETAPGNHDARDGSVMSTQFMTVSPGMSIGEIQQALGPPTEERALKNANPSVMGAAVHSYVDPQGRIEFDMDSGQRDFGKAVDIVTDPNGVVLRLTANPNPVGAEGRATQRGVPGYAHRVRIPLDVGAE